MGNSVKYIVVNVKLCGFFCVFVVVFFVAHKNMCVHWLFLIFGHHFVRIFF